MSDFVDMFDCGGVNMLGLSQVSWLLVPGPSSRPGQPQAGGALGWIQTLSPRASCGAIATNDWLADGD